MSPVSAGWILCWLLILLVVLVILGALGVIHLYPVI